MKRLALLWCGAAILGGCSWFNETMRSQSPEELEPEEKQARLVGDFTAVPVNMDMDCVRVENVGLVTGLHGTGSDPALRRNVPPCWKRCVSAALPTRTACWLPATSRW